MSCTHLDRFQHMVLTLAREALPPLPAIAGRVYDQPIGHGDPGLADFEAAPLWRALAFEITEPTEADRA